MKVSSGGYKALYKRQEDGKTGYGANVQKGN